MSGSFPDTEAVPQTAGLADSTRIRDDPAQMEDHSLNDRLADPVSGPRLRLAGTTAGPVSDAERALLDLRQALIQASSHVQRDAGVIRGRLERSGRQDPVALTTGQDVFARTQVDLGRLLAAVEDRLEAVSEPDDQSRIEVVPGVQALLRRS